jgi:hypothetical protein
MKIWALSYDHMRWITLSSEKKWEMESYFSNDGNALNEVK